ncbi:fumarylacetoacetate hydrolase family protein [Kiritimatiella glycovorans]|uniref:Ureidoglycolate lyase n=1 Tax=Kiritimatiella glycovorans TaxID=1307763 RepID=A0A0G3EIB1_9BACT|nr:fumarylacetoacetate hydrolase family protein [Kiritimatiella glycovorans]AKJ65177.1 Ureidoglycolate lyase [Kiritimatiella glycovorans]
MKLVRYGNAGEERPGVLLEDEVILDVRAAVFDIEDYDAHFFSHYGIARLESLVREKPGRTVRRDEVRLGPPVARPGKIIAVGENYADHAAEFGRPPPPEPILFSKPASALAGPEDLLKLPGKPAEIDAEVELAMVIGARAKNVPAAEAHNCIAGWTILNDLTDRRAQRTCSQWFAAKGHDGFAPLGPFLLTRDELPCTPELDLASELNGARMQSGNTRTMIFPPDRLIEYITLDRGITLEPGDVIATGTPPGIGAAQDPPRPLAEGDEMVLRIEGLGEQRLKTAAATPQSPRT